MWEEEAGKVRICVRRMYMWRNVIWAHVLKVGWRPRTVNSRVINWLVGEDGSGAVLPSYHHPLPVPRSWPSSVLGIVAFLSAAFGRV